MIKGFEEQTYGLTDTERNDIIPAVVDIMKSRVGARNVINGTGIRDIILKEKGINIDGPRLRKVMHVIRTDDIVSGIVAYNAGYFVAETPDEWNDYLESINNRIDRISSLRAALTSQYLMWLQSEA